MHFFKVWILIYNLGYQNEDCHKSASFDPNNQEVNPLIL